MADLQNSLEAKSSNLVSLGNDLQVAEEQYQRLMSKVEELQRTILQKDNIGEIIDMVLKYVLQRAVLT